ncbi:MAG: baseplate tail-tube junction protein [Ghiorsea sp.]
MSSNDLTYPKNLFENNNTSYMMFTPYSVVAVQEGGKADKVGSTPIKSKEEISDFTKQIKLNLPDNLTSANPVNWEDASASALAIAAGKFMGQAINGNMDGASATAKAAVDTLFKNNSFIAKTALTGNAAQSVIEKQAGKIANPNKSMFFKGVGLREFNFSFKLVPDSAKEANKVGFIVRTFKKYAAPAGLGKGGYTMQYPGYWNIQAYSNNRNLMLFKQCVLTTVTVDAAPDGVMATFDNGMPISTLLSLTFKETEVVLGGDYGNDSVSNTQMGIYGY